MAPLAHLAPLGAVGKGPLPVWSGFSDGFFHCRPRFDGLFCHEGNVMTTINIAPEFVIIAAVICFAIGFVAGQR